MLLEVNDLSEVYGRDEVVLDFWAEWCQPCKMISTVLEELFQDLVVAKVNVEEKPDIANSFGVTALPTLIFLKDSQPVDKLTGAPSKDEVIHWVKKNMNGE